MSDAAAVLETCMICFVKRTCRVRYLGKEGQGSVCSGEACRAKHISHIVRKAAARTASIAEKEAAKVVAREAKAKATADKRAAAYVARAAQGVRAKKKAAASSGSFFQDPRIHGNTKYIYIYIPMYSHVFSCIRMYSHVS